jgi:WD40 repeat protein
MMSRKNLLLLPLSVIFLLIGCRSVKQSVRDEVPVTPTQKIVYIVITNTPTLTSTPTATRTPQPSRTPTATPYVHVAGPTSTLGPTSTTAPTRTPYPTSTPLPDDYAVATDGQTYAYRSEPISEANAHQLAEAARWGKGRVLHGAFSHEGRLYRVVTTLGLFTYSTEDYTQVNFNPLVLPNGTKYITDNHRTLVTADESGRIRFYSLPDLTETHSCLQTDLEIDRLELSPNQDQLYITGYAPQFRDYFTLLISPETCDIEYAFEHSLYDLRFSLNGRTAAALSNGRGIVWDAADPSQATSILVEDWDISALALSLDGRYLALGTSGGVRVEIYRVRDSQLMHGIQVPWQTNAQGSGDGRWMRPLFRSGPGPYYVSDLAFSPDGDRISLTTGYNYAAEFDWKTGERLWEADLQAGAISYSANGTMIAIEADTVEFRESGTGTRLARLGNHAGTQSDIMFIPGTQLLAAASYDGEIRLRRISDGAVYRILNGHENGIHDIDVSPDGRYLLSGSSDRQALLWDLADQTVTRLGEAWDWVSHVGLSHDASLATFSSYDRVTQVIQIPENSALDATFYPTALDFSPTQPHLAVANYHNEIMVFDTTDFSMVRSLEFTSGYIESIAFSAEGSLLIAASDDGLAVWDVETGAVQLALDDLNYLEAFALSPDQSLLVTSHGSVLKFWSMMDGALVHTLTLDAFFARTLAFSLSGDRLAIGAWDGTVRILALLP